MLCAEIAAPPGHGIPPHRHGDEAGFFYSPHGRVHGFCCKDRETARLQVFPSPSTGIGAMVAVLAELTRQQGDRVDPAQIAAIYSQYNIVLTDAQTK